MHSKEHLICPVFLVPQYSSSLHHCFLNILSLFKLHLLPVSTFLRHIECNFSCLPYLAVHLVYIDMRLVHQEGKDAGVETVCDEDLATSKHGYRALEHVLVVKLAFIQHLHNKEISYRNLQRKEIAWLPYISVLVQAH